MTHFRKISLDTERNPFSELAGSVVFETLGKGRQGAILVKRQQQRVPIVRTTTRYQNAAQDFQASHCALIEKIQSGFADLAPLNFNNALVEIYDSRYRKMGFHSDQSLDLADSSHIALASFYEREDLPKSAMRVLKIKHKATGEQSELRMEPRSVILFSLECNAEHVHKIVLNSTKSKSNEETRWLGLTFRLSKTWVEFIDQRPVLQPAKLPLRLATTAEWREFLRRKGAENRDVNHRNAPLDFCLSPSDLLPVAEPPQSMGEQ